MTPFDLSAPRIVANFLAAMLALPAVAAPVLQVGANGVLNGAQGVTIGTALYDVTFVDGTCAGLFNGCNSAADFAFQTPADASAAAAALISQVVVNGPAGNFLSDPWLVQGCAFVGGGSASCIVFIPYRYDPLVFDDVFVATADFGYGAPSPVAPSVSTNQTTTTFDTGTGAGSAAFLTYAIWTAEAKTTVPEPGTLPCIALAGLAAWVTRAARRNRV